MSKVLISWLWLSYTEMHLLTGWQKLDKQDTGEVDISWQRGEGHTWQVLDVSSKRTTTRSGASLYTKKIYQLIEDNWGGPTKDVNYIKCLPFPSHSCRILYSFGHSWIIVSDLRLWESSRNFTKNNSGSVEQYASCFILSPNITSPLCKLVIVYCVYSELTHLAATLESIIRAHLSTCLSWSYVWPAKTMLILNVFLTKQDDDSMCNIIWKNISIKGAQGEMSTKLVLCHFHAERLEGSCMLFCHMKYMKLRSHFTSPKHSIVMVKMYWN